MKKQRSNVFGDSGAEMHGLWVFLLGYDPDSDVILATDVARKDRSPGDVARPWPADWTPAPRWNF